MNQTVSLLNKHVALLKQQLEERDRTIMKLRKELSELNYKDANQKWVELDD
jgi:predicted RNase H-like nuclease (RuvC/YqgF family)